MLHIHASIVENENPPRLDQLLLSELQKAYPTLSRNILKRLFQENKIFFQNKPAKPGQKLFAGSIQISLLTTAEELKSLISQDARPADPSFLIPILYEDETLLALHKPSGIPSVSHSALESEKLSAVSFAMAHCPSLKTEFPTGGNEPGLLHRLDTGTSGILLFAKDKNQYLHLQKAWKSRKIKKVYRALVQATQAAPENELRMNDPIAHHPTSSKKMIVIPEGKHRKFRGKPLQAITRITDVKKFPQTNPGFPGVFDFTVEIETGVMHQIRCHLSHAGWPIIGDTIYRGETSSRLWLHAWKLEFSLLNGVQLLLESQLPQGWLSQVNRQ